MNNQKNGSVLDSLKIDLLHGDYRTVLTDQARKQLEVKRACHVWRLSRAQSTDRHSFIVDEQQYISQAAYLGVRIKSLGETPAAAKLIYEAVNRLDAESMLVGHLSLLGRVELAKKGAIIGIAGVDANGSPTPETLKEDQGWLVFCMPHVVLPLFSASKDADVRAGIMAVTKRVCGRVAVDEGSEMPLLSELLK